MTTKVHPPLVGLTIEGPGPFAFIGDIHGCFDELAELIGTIKMKYEKYDNLQFISLGDVCDRGPKVSDCFKILRNEKAVIIEGNHDNKLKRYRLGNKVKIGPSQEVSIASLKDQDYDDMTRMVPFVRLPYYNTIGVHGGLFEGTTPEQSDFKQIVRLRFIDPDTKKMLTSNPDGTDSGVFWATQWKGPEHIIFGHAWGKEVQKFTKATGIDTGCVFGNKLTALVLCEDKEDIIQIHAKKVYWIDTHGHND